MVAGAKLHSAGPLRHALGVRQADVHTAALLMYELMRTCARL